MDLQVFEHGPVLEMRFNRPDKNKLQEFQIWLVCICHYPEGIPSHSPGLPANAGYPGLRRPCPTYPERVASFEKPQ